MWDDLLAEVAWRICAPPRVGKTTSVSAGRERTTRLPEARSAACFAVGYGAKNFGRAGRALRPQPPTEIAGGSGETGMWGLCGWGVVRRTVEGPRTTTKRTATTRRKPDVMNLP